MIKDIKMKEQIQKYLEAIKASYADFSELTTVRQEMVKRFNENVAVTVGNKYLKVVIKGSVHSFIVAKPTPKFKVGDILMAKSYKAPATNFARGNILDPKFNFRAVRWVGV
jgi:hypothetical protein